MALRAWPACMRALAAEHVRYLVRRHRLVPGTPGLLAPPGATAEEVARRLWAARYRCLDAPAAADDGPPAWLCAAAQAAHRAPAATCAPFREMDEAAVRAGAAATYGPVTAAHADAVRARIATLEAALLPAYRAAGPLPPPSAGDRCEDPGALADALPGNEPLGGGRPADYVPAIHDARELRAAYMRAYRAHAGTDAALDVDAQVTGASALRPPALFPVDA
jgi:hypothetical protein